MWLYVISLSLYLWDFRFVVVRFDGWENKVIYIYIIILSANFIYVLFTFIKYLCISITKTSIYFGFA